MVEGHASSDGDRVLGLGELVGCVRMNGAKSITSTRTKSIQNEMIQPWYIINRHCTDYLFEK